MISQEADLQLDMFGGGATLVDQGKRERISMAMLQREFSAVKDAYEALNDIAKVTAPGTLSRLIAEDALSRAPDEVKRVALSSSPRNRH
jgi:hypothetical protein